MTAKRYYITTPIYYVNSVPHIGTALTTLAADVLARYRKMRGDNVFFLTGTDENATKVAEAAQAAGKNPQAFVDQVSAEFIRIWSGLGIAYDGFIRTTDEKHKRAAQEVFIRLRDAGHIYLDKYEGWYDVSSETFYKESELIDGKSPDGNEVRRVEEENYFFRLSAFQDKLLDHVANNERFILPASRSNEVVSFMKQGLRDICISRMNIGWGIPVPGDEKRVIYVWFEALINYISAIGWPDGDWQDLWPAEVEWMGKDILVRFHATLWPAMLMGLGLALPKTLVGHAWLLMGDEKMSKSKGNVVRPLELASQLAQKTGCAQDVAVDAVRYYMARTLPLETDYTFTNDDFELKYNTELVNDLSNGIHRVVSMTHNFCGGTIPEGKIDEEVAETVRASTRDYVTAMDDFRLGEAVNSVRRVVQCLNLYIDSQKPWELNKKGDTVALGSVMRTLLWMVRVCEGLLSPVMPNVAKAMASALGVKPIVKWDDLLSEENVTPGKQISPAKPIYQRMEKKMDKSTDTALTEQVSAAKDGQITIDDFMKIELRVARVLDAEKVPDADKLLRLQLIVGEERRQVLAGIAKDYSPEQLIGKQVVLVANLKPRKMRGLESQGMILAADGPAGEAILLQPEKEAPEGTSVH